MGREGAAFGALLAAVLVAAACGPRGPKAPGREAVAPLLQQEADALKRDGEKIDPIMRVRATWTVEGIDIKERKDDADKPWAGTIRFRIRSETTDERGATSAQEFEKRFDYVYNTTLGRWVFDYQPSPAP
jgi:hypothetical protein